MIDTDKTIIEHYQKVKNIIQRCAKDDDLWRLGNGDFVKWYKREGNLCRLYDLQKDEDYEELTKNYRTLYWTLNFFDNDVRKQKIPGSLHDENGKKVTIGNRANTKAYSLGVDIDAMQPIQKADIRKTLEDAAQFFIDKTKPYLPNSLHACFSGGGVYIYVHHKAIMPRENLEDEERDTFWYLTQNCFNHYIKDIEYDFFKKHPEHKGKVKFDALDNSKRVFKTIFSIHKKYPYSVIPLNIDDIKIDLEKAKIPLSDEVIKTGEKWYNSYDENPISFCRRLNVYCQDVMNKYNNEVEPGEIKIYDKIPEKHFPPCIKNIMKRNDINMGKTRAITLLTTFLGQSGWEGDEAQKIFEEKAIDFGAKTTNIFESWFRRMNCPSCTTIKSKGGGFPRLEMGEINICIPNKTCEKIKTPLEYSIYKHKGKDAIKRKDENYFEDGKFKPALMADDIMKDYIFKTTTDNETIYHYNEGIYHDNSEAIIKEQAKNRYKDITTHWQNETIMHIMTSTYISREKFNITPYLIHLKNRIYNLKEMKIEDFTPDILSTTQIPITYNPKQDCPKIKQFLTEVLVPEDIPIIQELFGYCLIKSYPIQKAFMFKGEGANGKSTLINLFKLFIGKENISSVALQDLDKGTFSKSVLYGKLVNIHSDLSSKALYQTGTFKMLTGGDVITAEKKFKDSFQFTNYAKLIFSTNILPETKDDTSAFFRRWIIIKFPNIFPEEIADKNLINKITSEEELSGLFNWAVEGFKRLMDNGMFSTSKSTEETKREYKRLSSGLLAFVEDCVIEDPDSWVSKEDLYAAYVEYCDHHNLIKNDKNVVGRRLSQFLKTIRSEKRKVDDSRKTGWRGISLKSDDKDGALKEELEDDFNKDIGHPNLSEENEGLLKCEACDKESQERFDFDKHHKDNNKTILLCVCCHRKLETTVNKLYHRVIKIRQGVFDWDNIKKSEEYQNIDNPVLRELIIDKIGSIARKKKIKDIVEKKNIEMSGMSGMSGQSLISCSQGKIIDMNNNVCSKEVKKNPDTPAMLDTPKNNVLGKFMINHFKTHKGITRDFFERDTLIMFPEADPRKIREFYLLLKKQEEGLTIFRGRCKRRKNDGY